MRVLIPQTLFLMFLAFGSVISILSIWLTTDWLCTSGLYFLNRNPQFLSFFTSFCYFGIGTSFLYIYFTKLRPFLYIGCSFSLIAAIINFYSGLHWILSPDFFFSQLEDKWATNINSAYLTPLQHKLRCCGFKMVHDFPGDQCSETDKSPCLRMLISTYSSSLISCGALCVINSGINMFMSALFLLSWRQITKRKKAIKLDKVKLSNRNPNLYL